MLIQNTNPLAVAPHQEKVRRGFSRDDLFTCVHEQFMTDTARYADIVLPATMFLEHDDIYTAGGHQHLQFAPKVIDPPEGCRSNHEVIAELARRVGAEHPRILDVAARDHRLDAAAIGLRRSRRLENERWLDLQPPFEESHFLNGFGFADGKFRFKADWSDTPIANDGLAGPGGRCPAARPLAGQRGDDKDHPFKLATSPARNFLNSTFTQTPTSLAREQRPEVLINPSDAARLGLAQGDVVQLGNERGRTRLHARISGGVRPGVLISEGVWPPSAFLDGWGINVLVGDDSVAPHGGVAFHDVSVWARPA